MMLAPDNWSQRKARAVRKLSNHDDEYRFYGSCVEMKGPLVDHLIEHEEDISLEELRKHVDTKPFEEALGYSPDILRLEEDHHVTYHRSRFPHDHAEYPSRPCMIIQHSRIEYVWVRWKS